MSSPIPSAQSTPTRKQPQASSRSTAIMNDLTSDSSTSTIYRGQQHQQPFVVQSFQQTNFINNNNGHVPLQVPQQMPVQAPLQAPLRVPLQMPVQMPVQLPFYIIPGNVHRLTVGQYIDGTLQWHVTLINDIRTDLTAGFNGLRADFQGLNTKFDGLIADMQALRADMQEMKADVQRLLERVERVNDSLQSKPDRKKIEAKA